MTAETTTAEQHAPPDPLADLLTGAEALAAELGADQVRRAVGELRRRLTDTTVRIAVVGCRRAGRSTLLANLAGAHLPDRIELVDTEAIDGSLDDFQATCDRAAASDIVLLVVPAHAALSRTETDFLTDELLAKHVRHVILVVSHLDRVDEPQRVMRSVRRHADTLAPGVPVLPGPGRQPDDERLSEIREAIGAVDAATIASERRHQVAARLTGEVAVLTALAETAQSRQADHAAELEAVANQDKVWRGLRAAVSRRHRQLLDRLHGQVDDERDGLVDRLTRELGVAADPLAWWSDELPDRLRRELLYVGRRLDTTITQRTADGTEWLELELRTQLGVQDAGAGREREPLPALPVAAAPPELPDDARRHLLIEMVRSLAPVVAPMVRAARSFRGQAVAATIAEPAVMLVGHLLDKHAVEQRRADLIRQLPRYVQRNLDACKDAVTAEVAALERDELERLDRRWSDWRAVRLKATGEAAPDVAGLAARALTLSRQLHLLETTTRGTHS